VGCFWGHSVVRSVVSWKNLGFKKPFNFFTSELMCVASEDCGKVLSRADVTRWSAVYNGHAADGRGP